MLRIFWRRWPFGIEGWWRRLYLRSWCCHGLDVLQWIVLLCRMPVDIVGLVLAFCCLVGLWHKVYCFIVSLVNSRLGRETCSRCSPCITKLLGKDLATARPNYSMHDSVSRKYLIMWQDWSRMENGIMQIVMKLIFMPHVLSLHCKVAVNMPPCLMGLHFTW